MPRCPHGARLWAHHHEGVAPIEESGEQRECDAGDRIDSTRLHPRSTYMASCRRSIKISASRAPCRRTARHTVPARSVNTCRTLLSSAITRVDNLTSAMRAGQPPQVNSVIAEDKAAGILVVFNLSATIMVAPQHGSEANTGLLS